MAPPQKKQLVVSTLPSMQKIRKKTLTNYSYIHQWNNENHPKAGVCEYCGGNKRNEWALKKGKEHARGVENYLELCKSCHIKYDRTKEWIENNKRSLDKTYTHLNPIKPKRCEVCKKEFIPRRKTSRFCSNKCSGAWRFAQGLTKLIPGTNEFNKLALNKNS